MADNDAMAASPERFQEILGRLDTKPLEETVKGLNLDLIQGEVLMVYPGLGLYLVLPRHGTTQGTVITCCSMQGSFGRSGVQGGPVYEARDSVLVACHRETYEGLSSQYNSSVGYILCAAPENFMDSAQGYPGSTLHGEDLDHFVQTYVEGYATTQKIDKTLRDISFGRPADTFAGDFVKYGSLHTFLTVCASKASIGASPMAMVEAFAFHDKLRMTARSFEDRGMAVEDGREPGLEGMLYYKRHAMNEREGMGAVGESEPFTKGGGGGDEPGLLETAGNAAASALEAFGLPTSAFGISLGGDDSGESEGGGGSGGDDEPPELTEEDQLGVFRHTELAGPMADGELEAILRPFEEDEVHTASGKPPIGKVSVRKTYDGRHETRAAGGIDHVKSVYIPVPEQLKPHDRELDEASLETIDPEGPYEKTYKEEGEEDFYPFAAALESKEFDEDSDKFRNTKVKERPEYWRMMTREELKEEYPDLELDKIAELETLEAGKPFYDEPPHIDEEDPVTELSRRLYALESVIRQQPDGTIVISDGHGSEIRMFRGRITISSAADLELRPGRDMIELVPRRKATIAGEEVQIVSDEGNVRIKAETNVDVLAGNGEEGGRILLEDRSEAPSGNLEDEKGITIRTKADLRMTGQDMYIGVTPQEDAEGLERSIPGSIFLDSRGGPIWMQGSDLYGRFETTVGFSAGQAAFGIDNDKMQIVSTAAEFACGALTIGGTVQGIVGFPWVDETGDTQEEVTPPSQVSLSINGSIKATSLDLTGGIQAASIRASTGQFKNAPEDTGLYIREYTPPNFTIEPFTVGLIPNAFFGVLNHTDTTILKPWFQFDKPDDVDQQDFLMHTVRWQNMLSVGGGGSDWEQKPVKDRDDEDTYPYPGHEPDSPVLVDYLIGKTFLKHYIVNKSE